MAPLLARGVKLVIISGTSLKNIDGGRLAERFPPAHRQHLYLGLDRGANNYGYQEAGELCALSGAQPTREELLALHRACFDLHVKLLETHGFNTDIVFCRDNYCKIDVGADIRRDEALYYSSGELERVNASLLAHGYAEGVRGLMGLAEDLGRKQGLTIKATTDAKFIELGFTTKSDNVDTLLTRLEAQGIAASDCCFWGDEYLKMGEGIYGSDSFMITEKTVGCDFFDVSDVPGQRPPQVQCLGGGVERFLDFLREQADGRG
jgi:hypothetical protein